MNISDEKQTFSEYQEKEESSHKSSQKKSEKKEVKLSDEVMISETPESSVLADESMDRILSYPSSLTKKYPSHLQKPKKLTDQPTEKRPFASLTQVKSGESLINPNMVQLFYWYVPPHISVNLIPLFLVCRRLFKLRLQMIVSGLMQVSMI